MHTNHKLLRSIYAANDTGRPVWKKRTSKKAARTISFKLIVITVLNSLLCGCWKWLWPVLMEAYVHPLMYSAYYKVLTAFDAFLKQTLCRKNNAAIVNHNDFTIIFVFFKRPTSVLPLNRSHKKSSHTFWVLSLANKAKHHFFFLTSVSLIRWTESKSSKSILPKMLNLDRIKLFPSQLIRFSWHVLES